MKIRICPDYECPPIWHDEQIGPIDPHDLPISDELASAFWVWAAEYDATLNRTDPSSSGFSTAEAEHSFDHQGRLLTRQLSIELAGTANVRWWTDEIPTDFAFEKADRVVVVQGAGYDSKNRKNNEVLADVRDQASVAELVAALQTNDNGEDLYLMTPGTPTIALCNGRQVIAAIVCILPPPGTLGRSFLRCEQLWDGDLPSASGELLVSWLETSGVDLGPTG